MRAFWWGTFGLLINLCLLDYAVGTEIKPEQIECVLKLAKLPMIPAGTRVFELQVKREHGGIEYELSFQGRYGEPKEWWAKAPQWLKGETADWEDCQAKGDFSNDAACLDLANGYLVVQKGLGKVTLIVGESSEPSEEMSSPSKKCFEDNGPN